MFLLGDTAYPQHFLMKECANGGSIPQEQYFGLKLCRFVIECAFARLKARFGILRRPMDINLCDLPNVIYACFVLHNFCEVNDDTIRHKLQWPMTNNFNLVQEVELHRPMKPKAKKSGAFLQCISTLSKMIIIILLTISITNIIDNFFTFV